ncbi:MAG TPA: carboxypeptidase regulatory-like domain-containing protein, partial [Vicinamibacterales bacterium]
MKHLLIAAAVFIAMTAAAAGQAVQGTGLGSSLRVTVLDQTEAALVIAQVTIVDSRGVEQTATVDDRGIAVFENLNPGTYQVKATADSFRPIATPVNVRRGENRTTLRLALATIEQTVVVQDRDAADRRDNGFTQTLTQDQIDALPDDPEEMAEELMRMAGPGAQIFVNGFRGGRLPPKDQIQQIRFHTNSFSAEYHEAGMVRVEVITKPGMGGWRGMTNFGFRDESLNAKNHFADEKGAEQMRRYMVNFQGPIARGRTGLTVSFDGNSSYDSRTINAVSPSGAITGLAQTPTDAMNFSARVEHLVGGANQLQLEYQRRQNDRSNIGVGDFDLPERAYATDNSTDTFRVRSTNVISKKVFSEFRFSLIDSTLSTSSLSTLPAIRVNEAFNGGGAGQMGDRRAREIELAQNFDFTVGRRHSMRAGVLFEAGWWDSNQRSNAFGTYTFTSLDAYRAGQPATYSIRIGDPVVEYSQVKAGWFLQDDFRPARTLQMSIGLRQEIQTQIDTRWNLAPRAAFTWNATRQTTIRGGYGIFYDWYDASLYEQTIRVDGNHQIDLIVQNPSFPVSDTTGTRLPASIIRAAASLEQPIIQQASIGLERPLAAWADFRTDYMWTRGTNTLRSVNVNAPVYGVRPEPSAGNITEIQSTGERASDRFTVAFNARYIPRRVLGMVMYQYTNSRNFADFATALPADSTNPDADWGPSAQDVRHRIFFNFNAPLANGVRLGLNVQGSSALPYNITTGLDDNGDTVFNDRPAGVGRNSARGAAQWNTNIRLSKSIGLGGIRAGAPNM